MPNTLKKFSLKFIGPLGSLLHQWKILLPGFKMFGMGVAGLFFILQSQNYLSE